MMANENGKAHLNERLYCDTPRSIEARAAMLRGFYVAPCMYNLQHHCETKHHQYAVESINIYTENLQN